MTRHRSVGLAAAAAGLLAVTPVAANTRPALLLSSSESSATARLHHSKPCVRISICKKRPRFTVRPGGYVTLRIGGPVERIVVQLGHVSTRPYRAIGAPLEATYRPATRSWRVRLPKSLTGVNVLDATVHVEGVQVAHHSHAAPSLTAPMRQKQHSSHEMCRRNSGNSA